MTTKEKIAIMQAYDEGKEIEIKMKGGAIKDSWYSATKPSWNWDDYTYRVKDEPHYVPYANADEFLEDSKKHGPYLKNEWRAYLPLWVLGEDGGVIFDIDSFKKNPKNSGYTYEYLLEHYEWQDGTPCGKLIEDE